MPPKWWERTLWTTGGPGVLLSPFVAVPRLVASVLAAASRDRAALVSASVGAALAEWIMVKVMVMVPVPGRSLSVQPVIRALRAAGLAPALS
jgi:hypothetical protein